MIEIASLETLIPIVVAGIIAIATLAVVPILKSLNELKKSNDEIHKIVNSNFAAQTLELKQANERVSQLLQMVQSGNTRIADLLLVMDVDKLGNKPIRSTEPEQEIKKRADEIRHQASEIKKSI